MSEQEKNQDTVNNEDNVEIISDQNSDQAEEEVLSPEDEVEQLKDELEKESEKYLRSLADMDNLRKRCRRDIEEARANGRVNVLEELLPALDSIDMALKSIEPTEANQAVYDGMIMVQKQFLSSMERFDLKAIASKDAAFNPALHEAVSYVPSPDHDTGVIIEEMRTGYTLGERLLRASMVVVSSGKPESASSEKSEQESSESSDSQDEQTNSEDNS